MGSIYKITNAVNDKSYIGQTIHDAEKTRIRRHLNGHSRGSELVKRAIEKYGKDAFTYEILYDGIIPEFLDDLEIEAIKKFNTIAPNGYNLTTGGGSSSPSEETRRKISKTLTGRKQGPHSEEHRRKIGLAHKGKKIAPETRRKLSKARIGKPSWNKGKPRSEETCRKISEARRGKKYGPLSEEHRQKISLANKGKVRTEEHCRNLSKAHETPERIAARKIFFSLPLGMSLEEKRSHLRKKFPSKSNSTICRWVRKFDSETPPITT